LERTFRRNLGFKYDRAVECLIKDREALLAFYDLPAEHWKHLRTPTSSKANSRPCVKHPGGVTECDGWPTGPALIHMYHARY